MPKCSKCSCEVEIGAKFCFECGTPIPQNKTCPNGHEVSLKMKFCPECGYNFNADTNAGVNLGMGDKNVVAGDVNQNISTTTINNLVDESRSVNKCAVCGVHMTNDSGHTCPKCGKVVCREDFVREYLCCSLCAKESRTASESANTFTDPRDGNVYKTVKIGNQVWLAENFRYNCEGSYAYDHDKSNVKKYGRLYTWEAAMNCAPIGWHLPTKEEFEQLNRWVDAHTDGEVGTALKAEMEWDESDKMPWPTDEFGFTALPAGYRESSGDFIGLGHSTAFWGSGEFDAEDVERNTLINDLLDINEDEERANCAELSNIHSWFFITTDSIDAALSVRLLRA